MSKVRIINDETGDVKWVSPYVAGQPDQLKQFGYRVEDLSLSYKPIKEAEDLFEMEDSLQEVTERKKPGPKPKNKTVTE